MNELAIAAVKEIEAMKKNKIIADFCMNEALSKVAEELKNKIGSSATAKGVEVLSYSNKNIAERVNQYFNLGLIGCYMSKIQKQH
jgi:beta-lactamase class D